MERKVILYIAVSLDGYIADANGGVSWLGGEDSSYQSDFGYGEFISHIDTVVMGMTTYQQIVNELSPDVWVYQGMKSYVLTHQTVDNAEDVKFVNGRVCDLVRNLKSERGKSIWICGGANIVNQLVKEDLIDEYHLSIMPVILGNGIRLFAKDNKEIKLHLLQSKSENGVIDCVYIRRAK